MEQWCVATTEEGMLDRLTVLAFSEPFSSCISKKQSS